MNARTTLVGALGLCLAGCGSGSSGGGAPALVLADGAVDAAAASANANGGKSKKNGTPTAPTAPTTTTSTTAPTTTTTTTPTPTPTPTPTGLVYPAGVQWMTEDEEVEWMKSLGFTATVADLRASYLSFVPRPVDPNTNVMWGTETDDLRNWYRLWKRTGHSGFLEQARYWRTFMVDTYSHWERGGTNTVGKEHVYVTGLIDWWVDHRDAETLAAIDRIVDFILQNVSTTFIETRIHAHCIEGLAWYLEKVGTRQAEVRPKLDAFIAGLKAARIERGLYCMKYYVGTGWSVTGLPAGQDLRILFPGNTAAGIVTGQNSWDLKGFYGAASYQDVLLMYGLNIASRVLADQDLEDRSRSIGQAWVPLCGRPFYDTGGTYAPLISYLVVATAPEMEMFRYPSSSSPLYATQYAPFCPDATIRRTFSQQALLRAYAQTGAVQASELGRPPRYWPWQTWENAYFLTQK